MKRPSGIPRPSSERSSRPAGEPGPESVPDERTGDGGGARRLLARFGSTPSSTSSSSSSSSTEDVTGPVAIPVPLQGSGSSRGPSDAGSADGSGGLDRLGDERLGIWRAARARRRREREEVRRFTAVSRRRRITWIASVGGVLALAVACVAAAYTPVMAVREIQVEGARLVSSDLIVRDLDGELGTPLPLVDQRAIKAALVKYPLIQSYSVESRPPSTLVIRIVERRPVGVITDGDAFDLVDAAGVVLTSSPQRPDGYPLITFEGGSGSSGFAAAAAVVRSLPTEILTTVDEVTASTVDDVTLTLADSGAVVAWGSSEDSAAKAVALQTLMAAYPPESVARYDVSSPESVVVDPS